MEENAARLGAIKALIGAYKEKHTEEFFCVSSSLEFVITQHGISVKAKEPIPQGSTLLLLPTEEIISLEHSSTIAETSCRNILDKVRQLYDSHKGSVVYSRPSVETPKQWKLEDIAGLSLGVEDIAVQTFLLCGMMAEDSSSTFSKVIPTWPSVQEFRRVCPYFEPTPQLQELLQGTPLLELLQICQKGYKFVFQQIVRPVLLELLPTSSSDTNNDNAIWDLYLRACYVVRSRAHGSKLGPLLFPLLDQLNGTPAGGDYNVDLDYTPSAATAKVQCNKPIATGQELILLYGQDAITEFLFQYGFCSNEMLK